MSLINNIIGPRSFEIVRDQTGAILADEIHNQSVLDGNNPDIDATVWIERYIPIDKTEVPAVVVSLDNGTYANQHQGQADGTYIYNIDVYTAAKSSNVNKGDELAMIRLNRILGICWSIIEDPQYKTLGLSVPLIMNRHIASIQTRNPDHKDGLSAAMGRLTLSVRVPETTALITPVLVGMSNTKVKLNETDKGYFYSLLT